MAVHRNVGRACIVRRSFYLADAAPFRQILRRDVGPAFSLIPRNLNQAVIGANPQQTFRDRRLSQRKDRVVVLGARIVESDFATGNVLLALIVAREVRADRLPMHSTIRGLEQTLARVIERVRVVRGNQYGCGPLEAMLQVGCAVSVGKLRLLGDGFHLPDALIEARNVSLVVGGINDIRVGRIRCDVAGLASANVVPV